MGRDVTYFINNGMLYRCVQNDGATFLRHGAEEANECLGTVEEAADKYPEQLERALRASGASDGIH